MACDPDVRLHKAVTPQINGEAYSLGLLELEFDVLINGGALGNTAEAQNLAIQTFDSVFSFEIKKLLISSGY